MPNNELLTPKELAAFLRVPLYTAWRLARERGVPGVVRVGRYVRFERAAVEAWVAQGGSVASESSAPSVAA